MISAEFFVGYTAAQLSWQIVGDETLPTSPLFWIGGERLGGFNICFDPTSGAVYAWCEDLRAVTFALPSWVESFLLCPNEEGTAWQGLQSWPNLAKEKLEILRDMINEEVKEYGQEVLIDSSWVKYRLAEVGLLEQFLSSL